MNDYTSNANQLFKRLNEKLRELDHAEKKFKEAMKELEAQNE